MPDEHTGPEVIYAIRRADGHGVGMEDAYEYIPVEHDSEDPWDIAARLSRGDLGQVTYELIQVTYQPVLRRTYRDGHDIDDIAKDTPPVIRPCPGQTSLLELVRAGQEGDANG